MSRPMSLLAVLVLLVWSPAAKARAEKGKRYALLIGVNEYEEKAFRPLKYAENDIEELAKVLEKPNAGFNVRVLTTTRGKKDSKEAPTVENMRKELARLLEKKGKADTVLIAFSGHGVTLEVRDPDGRNKPRRYSFLCPTDADMRGVSFSAGRSKELISLNDTFAGLSDCGASNKLVLVDPHGARERPLDASTAKPQAGTSALFANSKGQYAFESDKLGEKGHGVFFFHVIEVLKGKVKSEEGIVTWDDVVQHVRRAVPRAVPKLIGDGAKQTPVAISHSAGESPVLIRAEKK